MVNYTGVLTHFSTKKIERNNMRGMHIDFSNTFLEGYYFPGISVDFFMGIVQINRLGDEKKCSLKATLHLTET